MIQFVHRRQSARETRTVVGTEQQHTHIHDFAYASGAPPRHVRFARESGHTPFFHSKPSSDVSHDTKTSTSIVDLDEYEPRIRSRSQSTIRVVDEDDEMTGFPDSSTVQSAQCVRRSPASYVPSRAPNQAGSCQQRCGRTRGSQLSAPHLAHRAPSLPEYLSAVPEQLPIRQHRASLSRMFSNFDHNSGKKGAVKKSNDSFISRFAVRLGERMSRKAW